MRFHAMLTPKFLRNVLITGLVATGLAGCGQLRPSSNVEIYQASLSGGQQVPPVVTPAYGTAEVQLNTTTNTITWKVSYSGLTGPATGAHIHGPAVAGQNAGIVVPFTGNLNAQPLTGEQRLAPAQVAQLTSGQWYVNIHTARHPGGEIRGQLRPRR
jgi:hypothetical protein